MDITIFHQIQRMARTPKIIILSSSASISICRVSFFAIPLCVRESTARIIISYIAFVAINLLIIPGLGNHGSITVAGVVPLSILSYRRLRRATRMASSAISEQDKLRTVTWKTSYENYSCQIFGKLLIKNLRYLIHLFKR